MSLNEPEKCVKSRKFNIKIGRKDKFRQQG